MKITEKLSKWILAMLGSVSLIVFSTGCSNTYRGVGADVEDVGRRMQTTESGDDATGEEYGEPYGPSGGSGFSGPDRASRPGSMY